MLATLMLALLTVSFVSCKDDEADEVAVSQPSVNFSDNGGSQTIQVLSNTKWTVSGAPYWLTVAPSQGSGNGMMTLSATANTDKQARNCTLYVQAGDAYTMVTVNQSGVVAPTQISITNGSTYTLERFRVIFLNTRLEQLTDRDFGTLAPGTTIHADIPTSATEFYMATYNTMWFFSPNYDVTYTSLTLTTAEIGNWSANSSASRYPMSEGK